MKPWLNAFLACQDCGADLAPALSIESEDDELITGTLPCAECELSWPVLGGVPFLVPDPAAYLSSYRESVLTTLVEVGLASAAALALVDEFCEGHQSDVMRYADDWTSQEVGAEVGELAEGGAARAAFQALLHQEREGGLVQTLLGMLGDKEAGTIIEVGPGAGGLSSQLADRCQELLLIDFSLRSVLRAQRACAAGRAQVAAVVGDASSLELASDKASLVVAANLVDLLDQPDSFLIAASRWLVRDGGLILSTPDPSLGGERDEFVRELLESLEFSVDEVVDGIPWIRMHSPRYSQLYWLQALRASILS